VSPAERHAFRAGFLVARAAAAKLAHLYADELRLMESEAAILQPRRGSLALAERIERRSATAASIAAAIEALPEVA
jgi:hypothetical protein